MNEKQLKEDLLAAGAKEENLAKIDFCRLEAIIDRAGSIDGLCKDLKKAYPDFDETAFKKAIAENTKAGDDSQELSDSDLEAVAGSWISDHKALVIGLSLIALSIPGGYVLHRFGKALKARRINEREVKHQLENIYADGLTA
ncbi:MAG: hypothetical protein IKS40_08925, partial [Treponema sp.]|nr:hypothetical protein [Treponema sp.]